MEPRFFNRMFWGIGLIAVGLLFLLDQMGRISLDIGTIFSDFWPVFLIYFGLKGFITQRRYNNGWAGSSVWNLFVVILGLLFLGRNLNYIEMSIGDFFQYLIPVGLIIFGITMIFKPHAHKKIEDFEKYANGTYESKPKNEKDHDSKAAEPRPPILPMQPIEWSGANTKSGFIGDVHLGQDYWVLRPMNISHFVGDTVLDLTKAQIPDGETRVNVSAFVGDVKVFIPSDMPVEVSVVSNSFLGDINVLDRRESGFFKSIRVESPGYQESEKKIRLVVSMFVGDVSVTRVG